MLDSDKLNLERVRFLLVDDNPQALNITTQVVTGYGVRKITKCGSAREARTAISNMTFDFILTDAQMPEEDGYSLVSWLRREAPEQNRFVPVIIVTGHTRQGQVMQARDCGVHAIVAKPLTPRVLLERIYWVAHDDRKFIECDTYVGPDRRFHSLGPPMGMHGRRNDDPPPGVPMPEETHDAQPGADP